MRISKARAAEIRGGIELARKLYSGMDYDNKNERTIIMGILTHGIALEPGPYVRAARRQYARLVLSNRTAD